MKAIFLADAHLKGPTDAAYDRLIRFFTRLRERGGGDCRTIPGDPLMVDHLIIAGDFFDFWFTRGNVIFPGFRKMVESLSEMKKAGIRITLCEGNHDFFLGEYFSETLGFEVYPEWMDFTIDGLRLLVSHGDTIDRSNRKYRALRIFLRGSFAHQLQRLLPVKFLWWAARLSSKMSKGMSSESESRLAEIMHRFARNKFQEGYDAVIVGHCHKPILHQEMSDGRQKTFAALGDWITHDSYLVFDDGRFSLNRFPPEG